MIHLVLPAYNEGENLGKLLDKAAALSKNAAPLFGGFKTIIIDDGSTDDTAKTAETAARRMDVAILSHHFNKGLGSALQTAFDWLSKNISSGDIVVTMDADNTHPLDILPAMCEKVKNGADIVIASRFCAGAKTLGVPPARRILSRAAAVILRAAFRIKNVRDYTCGYRAYSGVVLRKWFDKKTERLVTEKGFAAGTEILVKLSRETGRIEEVPLTLRYDLKSGPSKIKIARTVADYLRLVRSAIF